MRHRKQKQNNYLITGSGPGGAVALEGEVLLGVGRVHVLNGDAALHAAEREAGGLLGLLVLEDGDAAVLVLQRRLDALELRRLALQRVQADAAVGRAHHCHWVILNSFHALINMITLIREKPRAVLTVVERLRTDACIEISRGS